MKSKKAITFLREIFGTETIFNKGYDLGRKHERESFEYELRFRRKETLKKIDKKYGK